jgi:hypothetical protein
MQQKGSKLIRIGRFSDYIGDELRVTNPTALDPDQSPGSDGDGKLRVENAS